MTLFFVALNRGLGNKLQLTLNEPRLVCRVSSLPWRILYVKSFQQYPTAFTVPNPRRAQ
jgi:hypothetical protein